ncbi:putative B3 domain-containing protein REM15 isoform X2 [Silene latifolia]
MSQCEPLRHWIVGVQDGRHFTYGWKEFCLHLGFQVGDFVVFTYRSNLLFLVSLFDPVSACQRISSPSPSPYLQDSKRNRLDFNSTRQTETTENHDDAAIPSKEDHISCLVRLTTYNVKNSIINLPVGFARENNLQSRTCQVTIIDAKRRVWSVDMNYKKNDGQVYIKRGWKQFLAANHFKVGYHLCIQFIQGGTCPTFKCFRVNSLGVESSSARETIPKQTQAQGFTATPSEQYPSYYPSCQVPLSSYAIKRSVIYLPKQFLRESGLQYGTYEVKVVDEEERTWLMSLTFQKRNTYLFGGCKNILAANCFRSGEVICFQLLEAGEFPLLRCYRRSQRKKA